MKTTTLASPAWRAWQFLAAAVTVAAACTGGDDVPTSTTIAAVSTVGSTADTGSGGGGTGGATASSSSSAGGAGGAGGMAMPECTPATEATDCMDGFGCDDMGNCRTTCATNDECAAGFVCDDGDGTCHVSHTFVVVRSRTSTAADAMGGTPGPDIDAIELITGAGSVFADVQNATAGFDDGLNSHADAAKLLGDSDAFMGDGNCDLTTGADAKFWSMGGGDNALGAQGFVVVSFPGNVPVDGATIRVHELDDDACLNVTVARDDGYEVYIGVNSIDPASVVIGDLGGADFTSLGNGGTVANGGGTADFAVPK